MTSKTSIYKWFPYYKYISSFSRLKSCKSHFVIESYEEFGISYVLLPANIISSLLSGVSNADFCRREIINRIWSISFLQWSEIEIKEKMDLFLENQGIFIYDSSGFYAKCVRWIFRVSRDDHYEIHCISRSLFCIDLFIFSQWTYHIEYDTYAFMNMFYMKGLEIFGK